jgi:hypothetical protein
MHALQPAGWPWPLLAALFVAGLALWHTLRVRRMRSGFVSYRRSDSVTPTTKLVAELRHSFGRGVFHDVVSLRPGEEFRAAIARTLWHCDAALVMIGPDWATVAGADGRARLWADEDVVRSEVATALASGALVVPVLVDGASMPERDQIPPDVRPLLALNAMRQPPEDCAATVVALNTAIRAAPIRQTAHFLAGCHAAVLVQLAVFGAVGGLLNDELVNTLGITTPSFAAVLAVVALQHWRPAGPARVPRVAPVALMLPLAFVVAISGLVVLRSLNHLDPESFKTLLIGVEITFAAYTGSVLVTLRENRSAK